MRSRKCVFEFSPLCFGRYGLHTGLSGCSTCAFKGGLLFHWPFLQRDPEEDSTEKARWTALSLSLSLFTAPADGSPVPADGSPVPSDGFVKYSD